MTLGWQRSSPDEKSGSGSGRPDPIFSSGHAQIILQKYYFNFASALLNVALGLMALSVNS
jgi:hypothetical protein